MKRKAHLNTLIISTQRVRIYLTEGLYREDGCWGITHDTSDGYEIELESSMDEEKMAATLLHELLHVAEYEAGLDLREQQIQGLSTGLIQLLGSDAVFMTVTDKLLRQVEEEILEDLGEGEALYSSFVAKNNDNDEKPN